MMLVITTPHQVYYTPEGIDANVTGKKIIETLKGDAGSTLFLVVKIGETGKVGSIIIPVELLRQSTFTFISQ